MNPPAERQPDTAGQKDRAGGADQDAGPSSAPGSNADSRNPETSPSGGAPGRGRKGKPVLALAVLLPVLAALAITLALSFREVERSPEASTLCDRSSATSYDTLTSFIVPLEEGEDKVVAEVALEVSWPQQVKARFTRKRVAIRQEIYQRLCDMAGVADPEQWSKDKLAEPLSRIFERSLGTQECTVVVREVKIL
jgi:hypothetical protein